MKKLLLELRLIAILFALGVLFSCKGNQNGGQTGSADSAQAEIAAPADTTKTQSMYVCPMHPEETSDKPAKCSKCGMDMELKS